MKNNTFDIIDSFKAKPLDELISKIEEKKHEGPEVNALIEQYLDAHPIDIEEFPKIDGSYSRNVIYEDDVGFQLLITRWSSGAKTPEHSHHDFLFVHVVEGSIKEGIYRKTGEPLEAKPQHHTEGDYIFSYEPDYTTPHHLHTMHARTDSLCFHVYSKN